MPDKIEYYCYNCRETRNTYCGTDIEIGLEPTQTWPNDQTPCALQRDQEKIPKVTYSGQDYVISLLPVG